MGRVRVTCTCGHSFDCHGDRAITACDGGLTLAQIAPGTMRLFTKKKAGEGISLCSCRGWTEAFV